VHSTLPGFPLGALPCSWENLRAPRGCALWLPPECATGALVVLLALGYRRGVHCAFHTLLDSPLEHYRAPRRIYAPLVGARSGYRRGVPPVHEWYFWPFWIPPWSTTVFLGEFTRLSWVRALATAGVCHRCMGGNSGPRLPPWGFRCYTRWCALRFSPESAPPQNRNPSSWPWSL
jgi:hypothetical protein